MTKVADIAQIDKDKKLLAQNAGRERRAGGGRPPKGSQSAALVVDKRWRVGPKAEATSSNSNQQISNPPQISPQRPRAFRPAEPKSPAG